MSVLIGFRCRDLELVRSLLALGANLDIKYQFEEERAYVSALYYATAVKDADIVKLLLDSGIFFSFKCYKLF